MKIPDFRQYRARPTDNVFVFVCEDDFLIQESREIWAGFFEGNWLIEKLHVKEFEEIEFARLMDDALTPSLFAQSRLLMVTNAEKSTKGRIEDLSKLQGVASSSLKVIMVFSSLRPADAWTRPFPNIIIDPLKPADSMKWIMERYKLTPDIARYIVENVGEDLYPLHNEIEKLQTFTGIGKPITARDVDQVILRSERFGPYELGDAILARDYRKSVQVAGAMLDDGTEPLWVLSQISGSGDSFLSPKASVHSGAQRKWPPLLASPHLRPANLSPAAGNMNGSNSLWGFEKFSTWTEL